MNLFDMPSEIILTILSNIVKIKDIERVEKTCTRLKTLTLTACWSRIQSLSLKFELERKSVWFGMRRYIAVSLLVNEETFSLDPLDCPQQAFSRLFARMRNLTNISIYEEIGRKGLLPFSSLGPIHGKEGSKPISLTKIRSHRKYCTFLLRNILAVTPQLQSFTIIRARGPWLSAFPNLSLLPKFSSTLRTLTIHVVSPWILGSERDIQELVLGVTNLQTFRLCTPHLDLASPQYEALFTRLSDLPQLNQIEVFITTPDHGNFSFLFPQDFKKGLRVTVFWNEPGSRRSLGPTSRRTLHSRLFCNQVTLEWDRVEWSTVKRISHI